MAVQRTRSPPPPALLREKGKVCHDESQEIGGMTAGNDSPVGVPETDYERSRFI